jgi:hypothetical protein
MGEAAAQFKATMYLMWNPSLNANGTSAPGCAASSIQAGKNITSTASKCTGSVPIPLGYVSWGFNGCAIDTLSNTDTQWVLQCPVPVSVAPTPTVEPTSSYPQWSTTFHNTNLN